MLIDFSIENFKSFRERQTFTMEAAPYLKSKGNVFKVKVKGEKPLSLLKVAAIYGPNASGKSNLISAFHLINKLTTDNLNTETRSAFRFDKELLEKPSKFEINFIVESLKYKFELYLTSERIIKECLSVLQQGKLESLYTRNYIDGSDLYEFGERLEGGATLHEAWKNLTSPIQLFLTQAASNSNEGLTQLNKPYQWFKRNLKEPPKDLTQFVNLLQIVHNEYPESNSEKNLATFLSELDIPIAKVEFKSKRKLEDLKEMADEDAEKSRLLSFLKKNDEVELEHETLLGKAKFSFDEESEGTKNLAGFSLIWTLLNLGVVPNVVAIDEFDSSLHPKIIEKLISKFLSSEETQSQLIFTTHNTHLMDAKLLRRDQFWITERDNNGATKLASIYDYEGRESEDVEKRYYESRYRGLPNFSEQ